MTGRKGGRPGLSQLGKVYASIQSVPDAPSTSSGCVPGQLLELFKKKSCRGHCGEEAIDLVFAADARPMA